MAAHPLIHSTTRIVRLQHPPLFKLLCSSYSVRSHSYLILPKPEQHSNERVAQLWVLEQLFIKRRSTILRGCIIHHSNFSLVWVDYIIVRKIPWRLLGVDASSLGNLTAHRLTTQSFITALCCSTNSGTLLRVGCSAHGSHNLPTRGQRHMSHSSTGLFLPIFPAPSCLQHCWHCHTHCQIHTTQKLNTSSLAGGVAWLSHPQPTQIQNRKCDWLVDIFLPVCWPSYTPSKC